MSLLVGQDGAAQAQRGDAQLRDPGQRRGGGHLPEPVGEVPRPVPDLPGPGRQLPGPGQEPVAALHPAHGVGHGVPQGAAPAGSQEGAGAVHEDLLGVHAAQLAGEGVLEPVRAAGRQRED